MATSGSFQTNEYVGSRHKGLKFNWSRTGYDIAGNYSDIYWEWVGYGSDSGWHNCYNSYLNVNGSRVYTEGSGAIQLYAGTVLASDTTRIYHNSDGTKSFSADGGAGIYTSAVNCTGSGSWELDRIPRAPSYNSINAGSITETSVRLTASIDTKTLALTDGGWDLSTDGGATWTYYSGGITDKTITGLSPNTKYWYRGYAVTQGGGANSGWGTFTTYAYPYCTSAPDFTIGNNVTIQLYNPLNRAVQIQMWSHVSQGFVSDLISMSGTSYTGFSNVASRLYSSIPNATESTYNIDVHYGSNKAVKTGGKYKIRGTEVPTFSNFAYQDTNTNVTNITGNNQVLVKGLSTLRAIISSSNKMVANNSATPSKYVTAIDNITKNTNYSTSNLNIDVGTVINSGNKRLTVTAYDSRGLNTSVYKDIMVYDYTKPVINATITRLNNFENQTTIHVTGTYTKLTINNVNKNTITSVKYRYRQTGGNWNSWTNLTTTVNNGNFTCTDVILSLDNTKSFEFEIQATDSLQQVTTNTINVSIGQAIFFISSNNRACYINGQELIMYDVVDTW